MFKKHLSSLSSTLENSLIKVNLPIISVHFKCMIQWVLKRGDTQSLHPHSLSLYWAATDLSFSHLRLALFTLPRRGITRSYGNHMFNFLRNAKHISKVTLSFYIPTSNNWEFQGLHILVNTWGCQSFKFSHYSGYEVLYHVFNLYFPDD